MCVCVGGGKHATGVGQSFALSSQVPDCGEEGPEVFNGYLVSKECSGAVG